MANWEYKVLSGGKMGLGSMAMLEQFLNELGQQQWEVVSWQTDPETPLKFTGLAKRPIERDYAPAEMPAAMDKEAIAAAKEEEERERQAWIETLAREREFYSRAIEAEGPVEDDDTDEERDLASDLIDKLRPLMKRNKGRAGASGSVAYLAKKLDHTEDDLVAALAEAGLDLGDDETDSQPLEHGGDMFWLNSNSRGEVWINSVPKSRYRPPQTKKTAGDTLAANTEGSTDAPADGAGDAEPKPASSELRPLPEGAALLARLRPLMRRNRGGRGWSGSVPFLSRALRQPEEALSAALATLGLVLPEDPAAGPAHVEIEGHDYWLSKNEKGQVWIEARPKVADRPETRATEGDATQAPATETAGATDVPPVLGDGSDAGAAAPVAPAAPVGFAAADVLAVALPHLAKEGRSSTATAKIGDLATALGVPQATLLDALVGAGLGVPVEDGEKPVFGEDDGHRFWLSREDDALSLNAKPTRRPRTRRKE